MRSVSSRQNPAVRAFRELSAEPDPSGSRLLLDGVHLVRDAHAAGLAFEVVAVASTHLDGTEEGQLARQLASSGVDVLSVSGTVLAAMTPVRAPSGIVAIARRTPPTIGAICSARDAFVLAVEDVQDPGNLGSLLRAAEAGGATGALICGASATPFSVKAVRGSMGSVLRMPVLGGLDTMAAMTAIDASGLRTIASVARGGEDPEAVDWTGRVALWIGSEGQGLSEATAAACNARVTIPMEAPVESLNVAVAGAILVYAARRQRASQRT